MQHALLAAAMTVGIIAGSVNSQPATAAEAPAQNSPKVIPAPPAGKGQVVFYRGGGLSGIALGCGINSGSARISALGAGRYFILPVEPGPSSYTVKSEAVDELTLEVGPDETAYVKCAIKMGIMVGRPDLAPGSKDDFDKRSPKLKYVDSDDIGTLVLPDPANPAASVAETTDATE